jgi:nitroimidazol reductase NimA-like FMN-containing flavoprotein (pyridoxamine 5'-phosphate oxidase superfamily)
VDAGNVNELFELERDECYRYLTSVAVGRVAVISGDLPSVVPVNFAVLDEDIVFRTGDGVVLSAARGSGLAAFEVDGWGEETQTGWSVLLRGLLTEVERHDELAMVATIGVVTWAPGPRDHVLRLHPTLISGRRLTSREPVRRPPIQEVCGPDTPVSAMRLRPVPAVPPDMTIPNAIRLLNAAGSPVGSLDPECFVSTGGLVRALAAGASERTAAEAVAGEDVLVLPAFTGLLEALRMMNARELNHAVVQLEHRGGFRLLTVRDAVSPLLWVFDPLVTLLQQRRPEDERVAPPR